MGDELNGLPPLVVVGRDAVAQFGVGFHVGRAVRHFSPLPSVRGARHALDFRQEAAVLFRPILERIGIELVDILPEHRLPDLLRLSSAASPIIRETSATAVAI
ncbi:hypothetical protein OH491_15350 [Termitidicoccus mucosus]|uniref:hypothetical protein n=1 Tax=Termitidicoccus mucosus TaxID=1184151 RepID=UPI0031835266